MTLQRRLAQAQQLAEALTSYQAGRTDTRLQLGAGRHALPDWFNTDLQPLPPGIHYLDSSRPFPLPDASFDYVFSEHHLEHLSWPAGQLTLRECWRVLKPGGLLRIATPSLEALVGLITEQPSPLQQRYIDFMSESFLQPDLPPGAASVVNNAFVSWGHQFLYDRPRLLADLAAAGFVEPVLQRPGQSEHPPLAGIEQHGRFIGDEQMNQFETMVVEVRRPAG